MAKLTPPDSHFYMAAVGWLELGNPGEAWAELNQISAAQRSNPDVLEVEWTICATEKNWEKGIKVAQSLIEAAPNRSSGWLHYAYSVRRAKDGGLQKAWEALLPASEKFPKEETVSFNLACYACQLGRLKDARTWLSLAFKAGEKDAVKEMALADDDLRPMWDEIRNM